MIISDEEKMDKNLPWRYLEKISQMMMRRWSE